MKRFDLIMLATGLISLVLSIVTFVVLCFVFVAAVNAEVKSGSIQEGIKEISSVFEESFEFVDGNGIHITSGDDVVDIDANGINVNADGTVVDVSFDGVNVTTAEG